MPLNPVPGDDLDNTLIGTNGADLMTGAGGNDTIFDLAGDDQVYGGADDDTFWGGGGNDTFWGDAGHDFFDLGLNTALVYGGTGDDQIHGLGSAGIHFLHTFHGGAGADFLVGGHLLDTLYGDAGEDVLYGNRGSDLLWGGTGNDLVAGGDGSNRLYGGDGNDRLFSSDDGDTVWGGAGDDAFRLDAGTDEANVLFYGGGGRDSVWFTGFSGGLIDGGTGWDRLYIEWLGYTAARDVTLIFETGGAIRASMDGGTTIEATTFEEVWLQTYTGNDTAIGGDGNDHFFLHHGANTAFGGGGDDWIQYFVGRPNTLDAGDGTDTLLVGNSGNGAWTLAMSAASGTDSFGSLLTGFENFVVNGGRGNDSVSLFSGHNTVLGGRGHDSLSGGSGNDRLLGNHGNDTIFGNGGRDIILGGRGGDTLSGGDGDDLLCGHDGTDTLTGGAGNDEFRFGYFNLGLDTVTDFTTGEDQLVFLAVALAGAPAPGAATADMLAFGAPVGTGGQFVLTDEIGAMSLLSWHAPLGFGQSPKAIVWLPDATALAFTDIAFI